MFHHVLLLVCLLFAAGLVHWVFTAFSKAALTNDATRMIRVNHNTKVITSELILTTKLEGATYVCLTVFTMLFYLCIVTLKYTY